MTDHPDRKPGHLYVVLALHQGILNSAKPEHVEQFIEVEDHEGKGSGTPRSFEERDNRLLEFPAADRAPELEAELKRTVNELGTGWDEALARVRELEAEVKKLLEVMP